MAFRLIWFWILVTSVVGFILFGLPALALQVASNSVCESRSTMIADLGYSGWVKMQTIDLPGSANQEIWIQPIFGRFVGIVGEGNKACILFRGKVPGSDT